MIDSDMTCLGQRRKENNEGFSERQDYGKAAALRPAGLGTLRMNGTGPQRPSWLDIVRLSDRRTSGDQDKASVDAVYIPDSSSVCDCPISSRRIF